MNEHWQDVATLDDFAASDAIAVTAGGRRIAIYLVQGAVFATDNVCTHGQADLCDGFLEGHEIECPFHQGRFDVRTGLATAAPATEPLVTYPARLQGASVQIRVD